MAWHINKNAAEAESLRFVNSSSVTVGINIPYDAGNYTFNYKVEANSRGPITSKHFEDLATFVEKIMGDSLAGHVKSLNNAKLARCEIFVPHRLVYLYDRVVTSLGTLKEKKPSGDFVSFIELSFFESLVSDFKTGLAWKDLSVELTEKGSFVHMLTLLTFLKLQRARGTTAKIVPSNTNTAKSADAVLFTPLCDRIDVEIKSPKLLWAPRELDEEDSAKVVRNAWRKAKGQIGMRPSILVIGGIYIPKSSLNLLKIEANKFFERRKNKHVAYIIIISVTMLVMKPELKDGKLAIKHDTSMMPQVVTRQVRNPHYEGIVEFMEIDREIPGFTKQPSDMQEFRVESGLAREQEEN